MVLLGAIIFFGPGDKQWTPLRWASWDQPLGQITANPWKLTVMAMFHPQLLEKKVAARCHAKAFVSVGCHNPSIRVGRGKRGSRILSWREAEDGWKIIYSTSAGIPGMLTVYHGALARHKRGISDMSPCNDMLRNSDEIQRSGQFVGCLRSFTSPKLLDSDGWCGFEIASFTKIWEVTIPPTSSTEFLSLFFDAFESFRSWIKESFCQRNSNGDAPAQVGTFEEEQPLGKSKWKRNLLWTRNGDGMWSYWQNMSRMHANTSTYDTHLIVISYLHTVTYCMYVLLSVLASLRVKNTYPSIIEDALSTYVSFVFSPIFLNFLLEDHCFSSNQPQGARSRRGCLGRVPPPRLHWGKGLAPVVLLRGSRLGGVNHGEPSRKGEAGEQLHPG